jgi:hypothetical protein
MIATIGLVFCAYVVARMLELALDPQGRPFVRQVAGLVLIGAVVGAVLILRGSSEISRAFAPTESLVSPSGAPMTEFGDTSMVVIDTTMYR